MLTDMHHLVGAAEIAELLGLSRQRVSQLTARADFPAPAAVLRSGKVWHTEEIEQWNQERLAKLPPKKS